MGYNGKLDADAYEGETTWKHHTMTIDLARFASAKAMVNLWADANYQGAKLNPSNAWYGVPSGASKADAVAEIVRVGDADTASLVERARKEAMSVYVPGARSLKPAFQSNRLTGQRYDLGRVLQGAPGQWGRYERTSQREGARIVSIYLPLGASSKASAQEAAWVPVAGIVVADLLEAAGYRVEIWGSLCAAHAAYESANGTFHQTHQRILIKAADAPLNMREVSRAVHPAVARALVLPLMATEWKMLGRGGIVDRVLGSQVLRANAEVFSDPDALIMPRAYNLTRCIEDVKSTLAKFQ